MFERFTDRARRVVVVAQEECRLLGHERIGTEHLLLALARNDDTAPLLAGAGLDLDEARDRLDSTGARVGSASGHIPFTDRAKQALEHASEFAADLIGPAHLLLGVLSLPDSTAVRTLRALGVDPDGLNEQARSAPVTVDRRRSTDARAVPIRYPAPLRPGDRIGVTAPSAGVADRLRPRLDFCVEYLTGLGYEVVLGDCLDGSGLVSAPPAQRAAELTAMLTDPTIRAVVPPWGGAIGVEILTHLDFPRIGAAEPTWVVGYSDITTILLPLTTMCGIATLHGQNLMDTPYRLPDGIAAWPDVLAGVTEVTQTASTHYRSRGAGVDDWTRQPDAQDYTLDTPGSWSLLEGTHLDVTGRLIGGCTEIAAVLAGTAYGDVAAFARLHAPEGLIVYVEASEHTADNVARDLWAMQFAGWFAYARAVLVGRTHAPDLPNYTQLDAVRSALGGTGVPVVVDVDCGHVPPQLALVNGALTRVVVEPGGARIEQRFV